MRDLFGCFSGGTAGSVLNCYARDWRDFDMEMLGEDLRGRLLSENEKD